MMATAPPKLEMPLDMLLYEGRGTTLYEDVTDCMDYVYTEVEKRLPMKMFQEQAWTSNGPGTLNPHMSVQKVYLVMGGLQPPAWVMSSKDPKAVIPRDVSMVQVEVDGRSSLEAVSAKTYHFWNVDDEVGDTHARHGAHQADLQR